MTPWFPTANTPVSGVFVQREVEALAADHDVRVLHLDWQRGEALPAASRDGYAYRRVALSRMNPLAYLAARRTTARLARDVDVVHTHALTVLVPWLLGRPGRRGQPWVHSEHWSGISAPQTLGRGERLALSALGQRLRAPDAVIAESSRLAHAIGRYRAAEVDIVPCVVEASAVEERVDDGVLRLLGIGGLIPRKGPLLAVQALSSLVERGVDARLTWVGNGPQREEMLEEAARRGITDRLRLTGALDRWGVEAELARASVFLLPTQGDNFCVVVAEALLNGRPVVSGAATGAVDYSSPQVSRFVDVQSGPAYADAVLDLAGATAPLSAEDIAATVEGRFSRSAVAAQLTAILQRVSGGPHV